MRVIWSIRFYRITFTFFYFAVSAITLVCLQFECELFGAREKKTFSSAPLYGDGKFVLEKGERKFQHISANTRGGDEMRLIGQYAI